MGFVQALGSSVPHQSAGQAIPRETSSWRSATSAPERRGRRRSRWRRWTSKIRWWLRYMRARWCWNARGPNSKSSKVHNHSDEVMVSCLPMEQLSLQGRYFKMQGSFPTSLFVVATTKTAFWVVEV